MRYDAELLNSVEQGTQAPTLHFFRFKEPTVSYGRLQRLEAIEHLVPAGWMTVQRPTGGGVVFHQDDLCLSLVWPAGQPPAPRRPQDQYRWIHSIVQEAFGETPAIRMAACCDAPASAEPFAVRACFQNPVGYDLLLNDQKIVGGALRCTRRAVLYQGSMQYPVTAEQDERLQTFFFARLRPAS